ncbi:hypothetical protein AVEN_253096-1 [Araneus ventricosus]|uniref:Uncharacterized protein n=1 Tax=Araneus ventricosus TaxID=182803 RepID=A0A4Y2Q661_ARAVE|nr:hypothetical protein AVEN_253096-1 [Araneus ventricosus]
MQVRILSVFLLLSSSLLFSTVVCDPNHHNGQLSDTDRTEFLFTSSNITIPTVHAKRNAAVKKLGYMKNVKRENVASLPILEGFIKENNLSLTEYLIEDIGKHCICLVNLSLTEYLIEDIEKHCICLVNLSLTEYLIEDIEKHCMRLVNKFLLTFLKISKRKDG